MIASLWIYGPDMDPDEVTESLAITPTYKHYVSDPGGASWVLSSDDSGIESDNPLDHLNWLVNQLTEEKISSVRTMELAKGITVRIVLKEFFTNSSEHLFFPSETLSTLAKLQIHVQIDLDFFCPTCQK